MRVIHIALWPQEEHAPYGDDFYVGVDGEAHVVGLHEGEQVILREVADVEADAIMHLVELNGRKVWFGAMISDYRELEPDSEETPKGVVHGGDVS